MTAYLHIVLALLECARVRKNDTARVLVELDNLEWQLLTKLGLRAVFLSKMLRRCETFTTFVQGDYGTLVHHLGNLTLVYRSRSIGCLEFVPRILLQLLVAEAQATVFLVNLKHHYFDVSTNGSEV